MNTIITGNNVMQPQIRDAVLEVAIWGGETTSMVSYHHFLICRYGMAKYPFGFSKCGRGGKPDILDHPDSGYAIVDVLVDGVGLEPVTSYTFNNVVGNHTIAASFGVSGPW